MNIKEDALIFGQVGIGLDKTNVGAIHIQKNCIVVNGEIIAFAQNGYKVEYDDSDIFENLCDAIAYCLRKSND